MAVAATVTATVAATAAVTATVAATAPPFTRSSRPLFPPARGLGPGLEQLAHHVCWQRLRAEARRLAMRAARVKAEILASEAGAHLGAVLHIEDVDAESAGRRGSSHYPTDAELADDSEDADEVRAWNPGHIDVAAAVLVTWALLA